MAFEFFRSENDAAPIEKEIEATNGVTYAHGCLLAYGDAGTAVTTTVSPEFVYAGKDTVAKTGDTLACTIAFPEYEWISYLTGSNLGLKPGMKVQTDGANATTTTTSAAGNFELLTPGGASGTAVVGRFK